MGVSESTDDYTFERDFGFGINAVSSNVITGNSSIIIRLARGTLFGTNTLLIIALNILCMAILRQVSGFNEITKIFIYSVTTADLCTGVFYGSLFTAAYSIGYWPLGSYICYIHICAGHLFLFASVVSMLILNAERYIAVTNPLRYPVYLTTTRAYIIVAIAWLASILIVFSYSYYFYSSTTTVETGEQMGCQIDYKNKLDIFLLTLKVIMISLLPLIITIGLYTHLFIIARRHAKRIAANERIIPASISGESSSDTSGSWAMVRSVWNRSEMKAATTFFLITFSSIMTWMPYAILELYTSLTGNAVAAHVNFTVRLLMMGHCWLNVMIYYFRSKAFRQTLNDILPKRGCCRCCVSYCSGYCRRGQRDRESSSSAVTRETR
ncbi:trace amine-associated receptor 8b-like [Amphiura filiformis]|uniref:trace amine-associated receptor 8b-like n=1 Tax=Amphiura filiformis TaxID=82378 RepID=UPI003B21FB26